MSFGPPRWLLAIYYVCQVIFGVGYGDQATLDQRELLLVIGLMIFGTVLRTYFHEFSSAIT